MVLISEVKGLVVKVKVVGNVIDNIFLSSLFVFRVFLIFYKFIFKKIKN